MSVVDKLLADAGLRPHVVPTPGIRTRFLVIGPKEAAALLAANTDNRPVRPRRVKYYEQLIRRGEFVLTHQGIAFSATGRGLDLQHRLLAIVNAGVAVPLMVTEGLPESVFSAIDQHERRTASDALQERRGLVEEAKYFLEMCFSSGQNSTATIGQISIVVDVIRPFSDALHEGASRGKVRIFTATPVRVAVITLLIEGQPTGDRSAIDRYDATARRDSTAMSELMHSFWRQASGTSSTGHSNRLTLTARALIGLGGGDGKLVKIGPSTIEDTRQRMRGALLDAAFTSGVDITSLYSTDEQGATRRAFAQEAQSLAALAERALK